MLLRASGLRDRRVASWNLPWAAERRKVTRVLGLPDGVRVPACSTSTACSPRRRRCTRAAWKQMFDAYLRAARAATRRAASCRSTRSPTTTSYVDGKPRVRRRRARSSRSRGIELPRRRRRTTRPVAETVDGLGNRKNEIVLRADPRATASSRSRAPSATCARRAMPACAGRSSPRARTAATCWSRPGSRTCSRPASTASSPSASTCAASRRPTRSSRARAPSASSPRRRRCSRTRSPASRPDAPGRFGYVVGVDRVGQADALREHGADVVVARPRASCWTAR